MAPINPSSFSGTQQRNGSLDVINENSEWNGGDEIDADDGVHHKPPNLLSQQAIVIADVHCHNQSDC